MQNPQATIYCPNPRCETPNLESHQFCQQCRTLLPKRYLWVVGPASLQIGELLAERYWVKGPQVVLDTQSGLAIADPVKVTPAIEPYLKLFGYRLHIPQVYGQLSEFGQAKSECLLLEQAPIGSADFSAINAGAQSLEPAQIGKAVPLTQAWPQAPALRQLNWLWQLAQLWQPLSSQGVASGLLQPQLLRVEGPLLRLLELPLDQERPSLVQLGQLWQQWLPKANPVIVPALEQLCQQLVKKQIHSPEQLLAQLDQWLIMAAKPQAHRTGIATRTDQGPTRQRNEDACYPPNGTVEENATGALTLVCDGIGGHEGGDIASGLAIAACQKHLAGLAIESLSANQLINELETAVCVANDLISERNDQEHRQDRQRMGTTLVMAFVRGPEIYITHIGDSRAYWITSAGCYQVTLDDDVASREVRMGNALYREVLQQPVAGSLVQALGMGPSAILRPTVQRFILDQDCVFLLCSDGLSDYDRVEESWQSEILPILNGQRNLATASQQLIELANQKNGHDNVTVGLIHYQTSQSQQPVALSDSSANITDASDTGVTTLGSAPPDRLKRKWPLAIWALFGILLLGLAGVLAYQLLPGPWFRARQQSDTLETPPSPLPNPASSVKVGSFWQVKPTRQPQAKSSAALQPLQLFSQPAQAQVMPGSLPTGSVLQVTAKQTLSNQESWLRVKICSAPLATPSSEQSPASASPSSPQPSATPTAAAKPLQAGAIGWLQANQMVGMAEQRNPKQLGPNQLSACTPSATPPPSASP